MTWPTKNDFANGDVLTAAQVNNIGTNLNLADPTGITDGYVLTANGAGSMGWEAIVAGGLTLITSGTLSGATVNLTSISATYKDLYLHLVNIETNVAATPQLRFNNVSTSNIYQTTRVEPSGVVGGFGNVIPLINLTPSSGAYLGMVSVWVPQYFRNARHDYFYMSRYAVSGTPAHRAELGSGSFDSTVVISEINIICNGSTFTGGNYYLYGAS